MSSFLLSSNQVLNSKSTYNWLCFFIHIIIFEDSLCMQMWLTYFASTPCDLCYKSRLICDLILWQGRMQFSKNFDNVILRHGIASKFRWNSLHWTKVGICAWLYAHAKTYNNVTSLRGYLFSLHLIIISS